MITYIRQILCWAPELKRKFVVAVLFKLFETLFMGAPYLFVFLTLNDLLADVLTVQKVVFYTLGMGLCFLLQGLFTYLFSTVIWPATNYVIKKLRLAVGEHLRQLSMGYFSKKHTGGIQTLVTDEMLAVQISIYQAFPDYIVAFCFVFITPIFLAFVDGRLAAVTFVVFPLSIPFYLWYSRVLDRELHMRSALVAEANGEIIDYVQGIEVIKAFRQTGSHFSRFDHTMAKFRDNSISTILKAVIPSTITKIFLDMGLVITLVFATLFLLEGTLSLTVFLIFIIMSLRIYEPVKRLIPAMAFLRLAEPGVYKIKQLLETPQLRQPETEVKITNFDIQFNNVTFSYAEKPVLKDVSFTIPAKTITALVGPSGSGKTTITRLIARFWDVDSGVVSVGGVNIKNLTTEALLTQISMVFQDVYLFNDTIYQNIAYGCKNASQENIIAAAKTAQCHQFISALPNGYQTQVGEGGSTLSGGEKQRISIARAILKDAPIILLDEATASVDPDNEHLIQSAINALVKSKTLILIAHRLSTIVAADQIIVLNKAGEIEEIGKHQQLLNNKGLYARLWQERGHSNQWQIARK